MPPPFFPSYYATLRVKKFSVGHLTMAQRLRRDAKFGTSALGVTWGIFAMPELSLAHGTNGSEATDGGAGTAGGAGAEGGARDAAGLVARLVAALAEYSDLHVAVVMTSLGPPAPQKEVVMLLPDRVAVPAPALAGAASAFGALPCGFTPDEVLAFFAGDGGRELQLTAMAGYPSVTRAGPVVAWTQGNLAATRKQVLPALEAFLAARARL